MECKVRNSRQVTIHHICFNRDIVECKDINMFYRAIKKFGFNRDIVECKERYVYSKMD